MSAVTPEFMLFVQHGWADDNRAMTELAHQLVQDPSIPIIAPSLGYLQTWLRIEPLIQTVEAIATQELSLYPHVPLRIVGHSMGGLIWLEVLNRHPEWWGQVHSLVLIASPVGGADLGRIIDPLGLGIGIASDLGTNRKAIAQQIASVIPTLIIAGDADGGSDGTVPITCTQFCNAQFIALPGLSHPALRNHPSVAAVIREFWLGTAPYECIPSNQIIQLLRDVPGMTDGHWRGFDQAKVAFTLKDGSTIMTWKNLLGIDHVYVISSKGRCLYAGFVGWMHHQKLENTLAQIQKTHGAEV